MGLTAAMAATMTAAKAAIAATKTLVMMTMQQQAATLVTTGCSAVLYLVLFCIWCSSGFGSVGLVIVAGAMTMKRRKTTANRRQ